MSDFKLDLQDTAIAFAGKTNNQLKERYWLFRAMNSNRLVSFGTALTNFALSLHLPVKFMIKKTIFRQFCGGETIEECDTAVRELAAANIGAILDYSVEGRCEEEDFGATKAEVIRTIKNGAKDDRIPFAVFKVSGIAPLGTLEKVSTNVELTEKGVWKWDRIQRRVAILTETAFENGQPLFIDAEDSWIQNAIDQMVTTAMEQYNKEKPIIYNTLQLYRTDRLEFLRKSHEAAKKGGYILAVKLVRGAYMEKERERALEMGYPSPIHEDKETTDRDYNAALEYCFENLDEISVVAATHNAESIMVLARLMHEKGIPATHPHIFFSQLYGMGDNLSYNLAKHGYNVSKYVPYGPVRDAIPYLSRRAIENTSMQGQVSRELDLINSEFARRKLG